MNMYIYIYIYLSYLHTHISACRCISVRFFLIHHVFGGLPNITFNFKIIVINGWLTVQHDISDQNADVLHHDKLT